MFIYKARDYQDMSRKAANIVSAQVILNPSSVLGLATGSSPIGLYKQLINWYQKGDIDFSKVKTVNLDEYVGLPPENEQSYRYFMNTNFFDHINIDKKNTFVPNGLEKDLEKATKGYDKIIADMGGVDLQILGIGNNGHIGFNEPADEFPKGTHLVDLTQSTIEANKRFFNSIDEVPKQAYTMGIKSIMLAKKIVLIASGKGKAEILNKALNGPITPKVPASILQLHKELFVLADEEALSQWEGWF